MRVLRRLIWTFAAWIPDRIVRALGRAQFRIPLLRRILAQAQGAVVGQVVRVQRGEAKGLQITASASNPGYALGTSEPRVQALIASSLHEGDVFFDIGANVGFFTLIAARAVGASGRVYAFEPLPENVERLQRNANLNGFSQIEVVPLAVTSRPGVASFARGRSPLDGHLLRTGDSETDVLLNVRTVSIDHAIYDDGLPEAAVIKIDAEGAELEVLLGMPRTLRNRRPLVICELHGSFDERGALSTMARGLAPDAEFSTPRTAIDGRQRIVIDDPGYELSVLEELDASPTWWAPHVLARPI